MSNLVGFERALFSILKQLSLNEKIQRLLVLDGADTLTTDFSSLSFQELLKDQYLSVSPSLENGIQNMQRNSFLIITYEDFVFDGAEGNIVAKGSIYIGTHNQHILLNNNKHRLLQLLSEVYETLDGFKTNIAGTVNINQALRINFSEYVSGFDIQFELREQLNKKVVL
jgi:hypothetical protein